MSDQKSKVVSIKSKVVSHGYGKRFIFAFRAFGICLSLTVFLSYSSGAQQADTSDKVRVYLQAKDVFFNKTDSGEFYRFVGDAVFHQGTDTLYCDSLHQNKTTKMIEAFSNVRIAQQGGTQGTSDYLRYATEKKLAFMQGNVTLTDGRNNLKCTELTYDLGTKTGVYDKGGTLHNDSTAVTSQTGVYNVKSKEAHFKGHAVVTDPQYKIWSEDMIYNTETKVTQFFARSTVVRDSGRGVLQTSNGTYDGKNGIAHFTGHSSIWNNEQYIEGDTLNYNKLTGYGLAIGNVISIDTGHHSAMFCGRAEYWQRKRILLATVKPVLMQVNGKDTLYMRADTFYSAPMARTNKKPDAKKNRKNKGDSISVNPKIQMDSVAMQDSVNLEKYTRARDTGYSDYYTSLIPYAVTYKKRDTATRVDVNAPKAKTKPDTALIRPGEIENLKTDTAHKTVDTVSAVSTPAADTIDVRTQLQHPDIRRDTTWAIPVKATKKKKGRKVKEPDNIAIADTAIADSMAPLYFIGYHHVLIFSDSLQGKCDSVSYTRSDSTIRMMYAPVAWAHNSQITGDTILMQLDSNQLRRMYVPNNAFVVSQSGPPKAELYDQVQGKTLTAYFKDNAITNMVVFPDAECIYYPKDEKNAYLGVNQGTSVRMRVFFDDQKIKAIKFEQDPHQVMSPLEKVDIPSMRLSRFKWLIDQRPKSKEELFE